MKKLLPFLVIAFGLVGLSACGGSDRQVPMPNPDPDIILTFSAPSSANYVLEKVEGSTTVGVAGTANAEITLEVGKRYRIINKALGIHPFAFSSSTSYSTANLLLADSSVSGKGSFEDKADVKFVENSDGFTFTLTSELAAQLKSYLCTFHSPMFGVVKVTVQ